MAKKNETTKIGLVPYACVAAGFLLAVAASVFVVRLTTVADHQQLMVAAKADSLAQQMDAKLLQIRQQLMGLADSARLAELLVDNNSSSRSIKVDISP